MSIKSQLSKGIAAVGREDQGRNVELGRERFYGAEQVEAIPVIAGRVRVSGTQITPVWDVRAVERKVSVSKK